jgi:hypothetical protein
MRSTREVVDMILSRLSEQGTAQVEGYNSFGFVRRTPSAVIVSRENGLDTPISLSRLEMAVEAVRKDPRIYDAGPSALRDHGITHVTSPLWALLHLVSKGELAS